MSEIFNLNKARKARARTDKKVRAEANAVKFGRTKAEKSLDKAKADQARLDIDAHKRDK